MNFVGDNLVLIVGLVVFLLLMAIAGLVAGLVSKPKSKEGPTDSSFKLEDYPY